MQRRYGGVFRSNDVIAGETFHIAERDLIEQVLILLLDGRHHMRMRKLMLPPFHGEAIAGYAEAIEQIANREIDTQPRRGGGGRDPRAVAAGRGLRIRGFVPSVGQWSLAEWAPSSLSDLLSWRDPPRRPRMVAPGPPRSCSRVLRSPESGRARPTPIG